VWFGDLIMRRTVHHFGPDPACIGGMETVIRLLAEHPAGGEAAVIHPTWRPNSRFASIPLAARATLGLLGVTRRDVVHVHLAKGGSFLREGVIVILARWLHKTTAVTIHGSTFLTFAAQHRLLVATVLRHAHLITCLDGDVLELSRRAAPNARVELVPNPVCMDADSPSADSTEEIVLFAGEIGLRKGSDVLCRAWPHVAADRPHARCIMVGPVKDFTVPEFERLEVREPADPAGITELLRVARVVALPSQAEGMPMILTEAMASGRPFVSTPVGGIPELARESGVLVPVGDDAALAERLIDFLSDPQLALRLGEQGRRICRETRSVEIVSEQLSRLYTAARPGG
jgi:glycosyltransferase involved in cell wall biosynthesis